MLRLKRCKPAKRVAVVSALIEGCSIRSTVRMTGVAKNTIAKLLVELGAACSDFMDRNLRNLPLKNIQVDEIWSFVYAKDKNVPAKMKDQVGAVGSVWTWVAIDRDTKLVPCWMVGSRDTGSATQFIQDLAIRLSTRVQLTTDGHKPYLTAVADAFAGEIDYAMLVKMYGNDTTEEKRYSPAVCTGCKKTVVSGNPDRSQISTSHVERQNLTMRIVHAALYPTDKCIFKEDRESCCNAIRSLFSLQLLQNPSDNKGLSGYAGWSLRSSVVDRGNDNAAGIALIHDGQVLLLFRFVRLVFFFSQTCLRDDFNHFPDRNNYCNASIYLVMIGAGI